MPNLEHGTRLGVYEVLSLLGAGGMGEPPSGDVEMWRFGDVVVKRRSCH